jgi:hypothetical protein
VQRPLLLTALAVGGAIALHVGLTRAEGSGSEATLSVAGTVRELAADGDRAAALVDSSRPGCPSGRVVVWRPSTRAVVPIGPRGCRAETSTGSGLFGLALAGTRVAFVDFVGGNIRELRLRTATLAQRKPVTIGSADHDVDGGAGTYLARVLGDRGLLVFAAWHVCTNAEVAGDRCAPGVDGGVDRAAVWRFTGGSAAKSCPKVYLGGARACAPIRSAAAPLQLVAAGSGRVVVGQADGSLEVVHPDGALVSRLPFPPAEVRAARLDGRTLVVLRRDTERRDWIDVYDADSGKLVTGYRLETRAATSGDALCGEPDSCRAPALRLEDVQSGIAVYVAGRDVHLLRLRDGKNVAVPVRGSGTVHAQLEGAGLFTASGSRLAFEPFSAVLRRLAP